MSSTKQHPAGSSRATHHSAPEPKKPRGWLARNWRRTLLLLVLLPLAGATGAYFYKFGPLVFSQPYKMALEELRQSPQVTAALGQPIKADLIPRPSGEVRPEDGEARLTFAINGPADKDGNSKKASVAVQARLIGGIWGFNVFDVSPDGGKSFSLIDEINVRHPEGDTTPKYNPNDQPAKGPKTSEATPDQNINIQIDDAPAPSGK